jgi:hypothetical protein
MDGEEENVGPFQQTSAPTHQMTMIENFDRRVLRDWLGHLLIGLMVMNKGT